MVQEKLVIAEFVVISAGIMVSFILNEWREKKNMAQNKINILHEINYDLMQDSMMLSVSIEIYKTSLLRSFEVNLDFVKEFKTNLNAYLKSVEKE